MQVCRICLVKGIELHDIEICGLKEAFEALTNCLLSQDGFPECLCWECRARLLSCARFRKKALLSQTLLTASTLFQQCNLQQLEHIDRGAHGLTSSLVSETCVGRCDVEPRAACDGAAARRDVKLEPELEPERADLSFHLAQLNKPIETFDESNNDNKAIIHTIGEVNPQAESSCCMEDLGNLTADRIHQDINFKCEVIDENEDKKFDIEQLSTSSKENFNNTDFTPKTQLSSNVKYICNDYDTVGTGPFLEHQEAHNGKPYECNSCNYKAAFKVNLQQHVMAVHLGYNYKSFKCSRCDYTCCKKDRLQQHLMVHSGERPFSCICGYKCIEKKRLRQHIQLDKCQTNISQDELHLKQPQNTGTQQVQNSAQHMNVAFECEECGKGYHLKSELRKHIITHMLLAESLKVSGRTFQCTVCQRTFTSKILLSKHKKSRHPDQAEYTCRQCGYKTSAKHRLAQHQKKHTGGKYFKCDYCDYQATRKANLKQHIMCKHVNKKPFKCRHCERRFNLEINLRAHELVHTGEKPYKCRYCSFTSGHYSSVCAHQKLHSGEKPYKCELCDHRAARKRNIKIHVMNVHTRERPIKCNLCSYACRTNWQLKEHMSVHSSGKPYECESCSFRSKRSGELKKHVRKYHCNVRS